MPSDPDLWRRTPVCCQPGCAAALRAVWPRVPERQRHQSHESVGQRVAPNSSECDCRLTLASEDDGRQRADPIQKPCSNIRFWLGRSPLSPVSHRPPGAGTVSDAIPILHLDRDDTVACDSLTDLLAPAEHAVGDSHTRSDSRPVPSGASAKHPEGRPHSGSDDLT